MLNIKSVVVLHTSTFPEIFSLQIFLIIHQFHVHKFIYIFTSWFYFELRIREIHVVPAKAAKCERRQTDR